MNRKKNYDLRINFDHKSIEVLDRLAREINDNIKDYKIEGVQDLNLNEKCVFKVTDKYNNQSYYKLSSLKLEKINVSTYEEHKEKTRTIEQYPVSLEQNEVLDIIDNFLNSYYLHIANYY